MAFREEHLAPAELPPARLLPGSTKAILFPVDAALAEEFRERAFGKRDGVSRVRPRWSGDIAWWGAAKRHGYERFERVFRAMGLDRRAASLVDLDREVRLYGGFLVTRSHCERPTFHTDFKQTGGQALTAITPVDDVPKDFGLLYYDDEGVVRSYAYRRGEAILFGEDFVHSTQPGSSARPIALLSFTFGTDRMAWWPAVSASAGYQSRLVRRPDGKFERLYWRLKWRRALGRTARRLGLRRPGRR